jgi:acetylornithine deacetylase
VIDTLADLIRIESVNPEWSGPGEAAAADYVCDFFAKDGIETIEREVLPGRRNVIACLPGRDSTRRIVFEAHMDTVSVNGMTIPPFEPKIDNGQMFGRGSCDVKSGLATMMHALRDVSRSGEVPPCEVWLAAVVDEEHAYRGVLNLIDQLGEDGVKTCAAVVAEPTECRVVRANKGVLRWHIETRGVTAHSSCPDLGKNAITAMAKVISALENDETILAKTSHPLVGSPTCNIGVIEGGAQVNFVPDRCRITLDRRMTPGETADEVTAHYQAVIDTCCRAHPDIEVKMLPPHLSDEAMETPADAEVVAVAESVAGEFGLPTESIGVPFGCDVTKLSRAGVPGIIFGPGSIEQAHADVEFVDLDQVEKAFDFYRRFLLQFGK